MEGICVVNLLFSIFLSCKRGRERERERGEREGEREREEKGGGGSAIYAFFKMHAVSNFTSCWFYEMPVL